MHRPVTTAVSQASDPRQAVAELAEGLGDGPFAAVVVFCGISNDLQGLGQALSERYGDTEVIGCTSAGEITPLGYLDDSVTAFALPSDGFRVEVELINNLSQFRIGDVVSTIDNLTQRLFGSLEPFSVAPEGTFGFIMFDGMAKREEAVLSAISGVLANVPLFGGSAGDGLTFDNTHVLYRGTFRADAAVLALVRTVHPFRVFKSQHFVPTERKMVVTEADPARRIVHEINAMPAAAEYARVVGLDSQELSPMMFATHPVVVRMGGADYVRSIQKVNADGSLSFFCAIDKGVVLTVAEGRDLLARLKGLFTELDGSVGAPQLIIGCDCVLRRLEVERSQTKHVISELMRQNRVIGFNTFGEQYGAMHVNQTFTGVAIGRRSDSG